jgi:hypothetical protein
MPDKPADAEKQFKALKNSFSHLNRLRIQVEEAQEQHTRLLQEFLEAAQRNPSDWEFKIIQKKRTIAEGLLNEQAKEIFGALGDLIAGATPHPPPPETPCLPRAGCVNTGRLGDRCFYLCHKVA